MLTLLEFEERQVPTLPKAYEGKTKAKGGYTISTPREWTREEVEWIKDLMSKGYTLAEVAKSVGRTEVSIQIKLKRLGKKSERYNEKHRAEKYELNQRFLETIKPNTVLDLYCGTTKWWSNNTQAVTNDYDKSIKADYNEDAERLIHKLYYDGCRFDVVDLDPFGSAYDCFDLAVKMADKGLVITFGEMGHKRFKRLDYVERHYGIEKIEDFTIENLISEVKRIGARNKKILTPILIGEWNRISRVYFTVKQFKITKQWNKKN